ncbi:MAG: sulfurtransferase, partial [Solirubrobacteraceae bacterium]
LAQPDPPTLLDVRWELGTGAQRDAFARGHLPGAAFVDLDRDLAAEPGPGGRHPLPGRDQFTRSMRAAGVGGERPVVVYDAGSGLAAARAWWVLRYFGHPAVSLLDGGLRAWRAAGGELARDRETPEPGDFAAVPGAMPVVDAAGAAALAQRGVLLDARAPERFRGETEPIDPVAGHIPGARNRPMTLDLDPGTGAFATPETLRRGFAELAIGPGAEVGAYCGSGVSAAHLVLALELAGVSAALYPGSWSEWVADRTRPVATGP